jgi:hypothetical protein
MQSIGKRCSQIICAQSLTIKCRIVKIHVPDHHREGIALQIWQGANLYDRRLALAVGAGPYFYFDTTGNIAEGSLRNKHDWKGMASVEATWYMENRLLLEFRTSWVIIGGNVMGFAGDLSTATASDEIAHLFPAKR